MKSDGSTRGCGAACVLLFALQVPEPVCAEPVLRVRAGTHAELHFSVTDSGAQIHGRLLDDLDVALAQRELRLQIETEPAAGGGIARSVRTDADGSFVVELALPERRYQVSVTYDGEELYERSESSEVLDRSVAPVQLELHVAGGNSVRLDDAQLRVDARASARIGAASLQVTLNDELGRALATGITDEDGALTFLLKPVTTGAPGVGALIASSAADALHAAGHVRLTVVRVLQTQLSLLATTANKPARLRIESVLRDARGPLGQRAVTILLDGEAIATLQTDPAGAIARDLPWPEQAHTSGVHFVRARFDSDAPWLISSRSPALRVAAPEPALPSPRWLLGPASAAIALAWWLTRRSARSLEAASSGSGAPTARARRFRPRTQALSHSIAGVLEDNERLEPITGARVEVTRSGVPVAMLEPAVDGRFATADLAPGDYEIVASAAGFASERWLQRVPYSLTSDELRVRLVSLRSLALLAHRPVAQRLLHTPELMATHTPRDALRHAQARVDVPADLRKLTELVERAAYARSVPTLHDLERIQHAVEATLQALHSRRPGEPHIPERER